MATLSLVAAVAAAVRTESVEAAPPVPGLPEDALRFLAPGAATDVRAAAARDLFSPERRPPARRYRPPGDEPEDAGAEPVVTPVVLGTAISGDGRHFAMCQIGEERPAIVRIGDRCGGYAVVAIERTRVVFRSPSGERLAIDASKPVP
jgi:hypothetical protein